MTMTRKDYVLLAEALRGVELGFGPGQRPAWDAWRDSVLAVTAALESTNPRFDRDRFLRASGVVS